MPLLNLQLFGPSEGSTPVGVIAVVGVSRAHRDNPAKMIGKSRGDGRGKQMRIQSPRRPRSLASEQLEQAYWTLWGVWRRS